MPLKILINGAGVAGPALVWFLLRADPGHAITVVERHPDGLRLAGQQIDLRAQGIPTVRRMGLLDKVKARCVAEDGMAVVDARGRTRAFFGKNDSGAGAQSLTSEYEIMRGDLVDVLYEASLEADAQAREQGQQTESGGGGGVKYEFGKWMTALQQDGDGATVTFSDGQTTRFDLVVGADGQGSRTRKLAWGADAADAAFHDLGIYMAYFSVPRDDKIDGDGGEALGRVCFMPGRRLIATRSGGDRPVAQGFVATYAGPGDGRLPALREVVKKPVAAQKAFCTDLIRGGWWQSDRIAAALDVADDFYMQSIGQVKMDRWSKGRVVLLGDAGYCPSPVTGMGTTSALVGAYVLAGELARHPDDIEAALDGYETVLRPYVKEAQKTKPGLFKFLYPETEWGVKLLVFIISLFSMLKLDKIISRLGPENKGGWEAPEYAELKL